MATNPTRMASIRDIHGSPAPPNPPKPQPSAWKNPERTWGHHRSSGWRSRNRANPEADKRGWSHAEGAVAATTRRYSPGGEGRRGVGWSGTPRAELGTEHGTVSRVARQLGYGAESVRSPGAPGLTRWRRSSHVRSVSLSRRYENSSSSGRAASFEHHGVEFAVPAKRFEDALDVGAAQRDRQLRLYTHLP